MTSKVKIEAVLDHLDRDLTKALEDAVNVHIPGAQFDARQLYKEFVKRAYRRCSVWEQVPDQCVEIK